MTGAHAEHCPPSFWLLPIPDSDASPADEHPAPAGLVLGSSRVTAAAPRRRRLGAAKRPPSPNSTRCWIACPAATRPCPAGGVCRPPRSVRRSETRSEGWETVIGGGDRRRRSEAEIGGRDRRRRSEAEFGGGAGRCPAETGFGAPRHPTTVIGVAMRRAVPELPKSGGSRSLPSVPPGREVLARAARHRSRPPPRRTDSGDGSTGGRIGSRRLAHTHARASVCAGTGGRAVAAGGSNTFLRGT